MCPMPYQTISKTFNKRNPNIISITGIQTGDLKFASGNYISPGRPNDFFNFKPWHRTNCERKMKEAFAGLEFDLTEMCFPLIIIPWAWDIRINCKWFWGSIIYCIILAASLLFPYPKEEGGGQAPNFQEQWIIAGNCVANYNAKVVVKLSFENLRRLEQ